MSRRRMLMVGYLPELHFTFSNDVTWSYDLPYGYNTVSYTLYASDMHSDVIIEYRDEVIDQGTTISASRTISGAGGVLKIYAQLDDIFSGEITIRRG